ncbi:DUF1616 domain-containing protein [Halobacterium yunchengense]|uniref:DUF1616 domain-containing protein n=1 Tax=Halobacterium yunchengense TaxID=3108497 RepID=UPI0030087C3B
MATQNVRWLLDLVLGTAYAVLVPVAVLALGAAGGVRAALALPFVLFVPGYAFLAAVYPARWSGSTAGGVESDPVGGQAGHDLGGNTGLDGIAPGERLLLSVVASAALVALLALVVNFSPFGVRSASVYVAVSAFTVACFAVALVRRAGKPTDRRSGVPVRGALNEVAGQFTVHSSALLAAEDGRPTSRREVALNLLVAVAVLSVVAGAAFAYAAPTGDQQFTEFYLVGENETGEYTVNAVPSSLDAGEQRTVSPTVTNQEDTAREYTVVAELQRVSRGDGEVSVQATHRLDTMTTEAAPGETARVDHQVGPLDGGSDYRVVYLLYVGDPPQNPSRENAHRSVRLWLDVPDGGGGS